MTNLRPNPNTTAHRTVQSPATGPATPNPTATELTPAVIRRRLLSLARPVLAPLGLSALARIIELCCGIAMFGLAGWAIGAVAEGTALSVGSIIVILIGLALLKGLTRYGEQFFGHLVAFKALARLRVYFYDRLEPQAPAAVEGRASGDLLSRVTKDVDRIEVFFAHTLVPAVTAIIVPIVTVGCFAWLVSVWGAVLLLIVLLLVGWVIPMLGQLSSARAATTVRAGRGALAQHVTDSVQGVREVVGFSYQPRRLAEQAELDAPIGQGLARLGRAAAIRRGLNVLAIAGCLIGEFATLVAMGSSTSTVTMGMALTIAAFPAALAVEDFVADLGQAYASARRFFQITDASPLVPDIGATMVPKAESPIGRRGEGWRATPRPTAPTVTFDQVSFIHPGLDGQPSRSIRALDSISFEAPAEKFTAIVGASGSGKSTLASLLVRSWDTDAGVIQLDGTDIRTLALTQLRADVGIATQHPYLFHDTIEANLRLARPGATAQEIQEACRISCFDEVLRECPDGLATDVGEFGERLSGGQRQRLALARTLLAQPAVVVLDEVTSQLDAATESRVLTRLHHTLGHRTILFIAHRLSTVRQADQIVVFDAGRVVQQGTYDELSHQPGAFVDLLAREL